MKTWKDTNIVPTPEDAGLTLTVTVTVYDKGIIMFDEEPMNKNKDQAMGYISVMGRFAEKVDMLRKAAAKRGKAS